jgi:hypothetical protein
VSSNPELTAEASCFERRPESAAPFSANGDKSVPDATVLAGHTPGGATIGSGVEASLGEGSDAAARLDASVTPTASSNTSPPLCSCGASARHSKDANRCARGHVLAGNALAVTDGLYRAPQAEHTPIPSDWRETYRRTLHTHIERLGATLAIMPPARLSTTRVFDRLLTAIERAQRIEAELRQSQPEGRGRRTRATASRPLADLSEEELQARLVLIAVDLLKTDPALRRDVLRQLRAQHKEWRKLEC